ncbi:MAG: Ig-like domain-containing protein [Lachnospiraceae bacterium]|nr:Ig-like domain-containing protein [Lachnospiraceae bacterium]
MGYKKILAWGLSLVMACGVLPILPGSVAKADGGYKVQIKYSSPVKVYSGEAVQNNVTGAMENVEFDLSDTHNYYFPEGYSSYGTTNGVTVSSNGYSHVVVSGTPTADTTITLAFPTEKDEQFAPSVTGSTDSIDGTTTAMEYAAPNSTSWTECTANKTTVATGKWRVRYKETDTKKAGTEKTVAVGPKYYVLVYGPGGTNFDATTGKNAAGHMKVNLNAGATKQENVSDNYEPVIIYAEDNYCFPDGYYVDAVNGIEVKKISPVQLKIEGIPEANTRIDLKAAELKETPEAPAVSGGEEKIIGTTAKMEYASAESPTVWRNCDEGNTITTPGEKYVRIKATEANFAGKTATVTVREKNTVDPSKGHTVSILTPKGGHITVLSTSSDKLMQTGVTGPMQNVEFTADAGYEFSTNYKVDSVNGIKVLKYGTKKIVVCGAPTDDTVLTLAPATPVSTTYYRVNVINGTGSGNYTSGVSVSVSANNKDGMTFTGWKVKKGSIVLANSGAAKTSFTMVGSDVTVEACYKTATTTPGVTPTPVEKVEVTPISDEVKANNSAKLDISAKVVASGDSWKVSWNSVTDAAGYDVYVTTSSKTVDSVSASSSVTGQGNVAYIKTVNGQSIDKTKTYYFRVKAYRIVNKTKEYIGNSRILSACGKKNKKYTNVKKVKAGKSKYTVSVGKTIKLKTKVTKEKYKKKLVKNTNGKQFIYVSSNPSVATVSKTGKVKGISKGNCTVYIIAANGKKAATAVIVE